MDRDRENIFLLYESQWSRSRVVEEEWTPEERAHEIASELVANCVEYHDHDWGGLERGGPKSGSGLLGLSREEFEKYVTGCMRETIDSYIDDDYWSIDDFKLQSRVIYNTLREFLREQGHPHVARQINLNACRAAIYNIVVSLEERQDLLLSFQEFVERYGDTPSEDILKDELWSVQRTIEREELDDFDI